MELVNDSTVETTWFCYNSNDLVRIFALGQGDLSANGGRVTYHPPKNDTGRYYVNFYLKGAPLAAAPFAGAEVGASYKLVFKHSRGQKFGILVEEILHRRP
jgi:hypothetical protein